MSGFKVVLFLQYPPKISDMIQVDKHICLDGFGDDEAGPLFSLDFFHLDMVDSFGREDKFARHLKKTNRAMFQHSFQGGGLLSFGGEMGNRR